MCVYCAFFFAVLYKDTKTFNFTQQTYWISNPVPKISLQVEYFKVEI